MNLPGSVVLITGASSGFGAATARRCAAAGARVALAARSVERLEAIALSIRKQGGDAIALPTDVTQDVDVARLVEATVARFGRIDVLVNSAGVVMLNNIADAQLEELEALLAVNLIGAARCIKAVLPHMRAQGRGQIVNMASIAGLLAMHNCGFYGASKAALVSLNRSLQLDLNDSGIRCVAICPGVARTPFFGRAGLERLPKTAYLVPWLSEETVAETIVRAVEFDRQGEIIVPGFVHGLIRLANTSPALARLVLSFIK